MADERQQDPREMFAVTEYAEGPVFKDDLVEVDALRVVHPPMTDTLALKVTGRNGSVVFSSDTSYSPVGRIREGAGILVHEVMHRAGTERMCERLKSINPNLMEHMTAGHTFGDDVGQIATDAGVGHLVVQHFTPRDDELTGPAEYEAVVR